MFGTGPKIKTFSTAISAKRFLERVKVLIPLTEEDSDLKSYKVPKLNELAITELERTNKDGFDITWETPTDELENLKEVAKTQGEALANLKTANDEAKPLTFADAIKRVKRIASFNQTFCQCRSIV